MQLPRADEIEQREKVLATKQSRSGKDTHKHTNRPSEDTSVLRAELVRAGPTDQEIKQLVSRTYAEPVVSLYLNLTPDKVIRDKRVYLSVYNSMVREEMKRLTHSPTLTHNQMESIKSDLHELFVYLTTYFDPEGIRSVVLYKSGKELNRIYLLPVRTTDRLTVGRIPDVSGLERVLARTFRVLLARVALDETVFQTYRLRSLWQEDRVESDGLPIQVDGGRAGKSQRHRLNLFRVYLRKVARRTETLMRQGYDNLIVTGDPRASGFLLEELKPDVREKIIDDVAILEEDGHNAIAEKLALRLEQMEAMEEERKMSDLGKLENNRQLVSGIAYVLEAQNLFLVRRLFIDESYRTPGWVCQNRHFASLREVRCPYCEQSLVRVGNVADELVEIAERHAADVTVVRHRPDLLAPFYRVAAEVYKTEGEIIA